MRQCILKRELIEAEFNHISEYPLTLAVAAMGYGKTTAARDYFSNSTFRNVWLTVDSDESSPQFIWGAFTNQLSKVYPEAGEKLHALGFPVDAPQRDSVLRVIEDLTYMTDSVLVIDDYHNAHSAEMDKLIERLVRANIKGFHILILSRTVPKIGVEELLLKGYCHMIKSSFFEITAPEIGAFFKLYGHDIPGETAKKVHDISEGWVSAVYLIMQEYAEAGKISAGQSMERLIETAVMKRYTQKESLLLKSLCILDSFTPRQAAYVTGDGAAEEILRKMSYHNSFIRYDTQEDVYRIHNVFSGYLQKLSRPEPPEAGVNVLYKRSGEWCIQNGDILAGLKYLIKAREYDLILCEFEKSVSITRVMDSSPMYVLELFKQIPEEARRRRPIGYLAYTGFLVTNVDGDAGLRLLSDLEQYYEGDCGLPPEMRRRIRGEIELIRAYIGFNDAPLMRRRFRKAHETLEGRSAIANERKIITFGSPHALYLYYREAGRLLPTKQCVQDMFVDYTDLAGGCGRGFDDLLEAEYLLETGELKKAELIARRAAQKAESFDQTEVLISAVFTIARVYAAGGKFDEALSVMAELREDMKAAGPILSSAYDVSLGYIGGIAGREDTFSRWLGEGDLEQSDILYQGMGFNYIVYGKQLLLKRDYIKLEVLCEQMQQVFSPFQNILGYLHAHIMSAVACRNLYGMDRAKKSLLKALEIGKADGVVLTFAEYGAYTLDILKNLRPGCEGGEYLERLIEASSAYSDNLTSFHARKTDRPVLTAREKEVLALLTEGRSNQEIASALFIAEVTVRKNITAIYRKLNVSGRAGAVRKTLEMKMLGE